MRFFIILFILICVEVTLIAKVGTMIGFLYTFCLIVLTAVIGSWQLKKQWRFVIGKMQTMQSEPSDALLEAFILLMSGVFLISPGFLTDIVGFLGLVPAAREVMARFIKRHFSQLNAAGFKRFTNQNPEQSQTDGGHTPNVIEGEFERQDDKSNSELN